MKGPIPVILNHAYTQLKYAPEVPVQRWQAVDTEGHFKEIVNFSFQSPIPAEVYWLAEVVRPNLPWAEDHFQERVSGEPLNPGEQYKNWPFWTPAAEDQMRRVGGKFSHTYMERFWPRDEGVPDEPKPWGIRYRYGDLLDVVEMLHKDPYTRQAYVPIWFPEDTGAVHGERVPCSIGYHFLMRNNELHCFYVIRSVDFVHYFRDDIYMACRLCQWMLDELRKIDRVDFGLDDSPDTLIWDQVTTGNLYMTIFSLHVFGKDFHVLGQ